MDSDGDEILLRASGSKDDIAAAVCELRRAAKILEEAL